MAHPIKFDDVLFGEGPKMSDFDVGPVEIVLLVGDFRPVNRRLGGHLLRLLETPGRQRLLVIIEFDVSQIFQVALARK